MHIHSLARGESIRLVLPDGRVVRLVGLGRRMGKALVGVEADRGVKVYREEMLPVRDGKEGGA